MTENSAHFLQWLALAAALGFIIGEAYGDLRRHRKYFQQATRELRERLEQAAPPLTPSTAPSNSNGA